MKKRRSNFLSEFVANQYPIDKFRLLIIDALDLADNFQLILDSGFNYDSSSISSYGDKYGLSKYNKNSKVESLYIKYFDDEEKMKNFLAIFWNAYDLLNEEEKEIFDATFINKMTDIEIADIYKTHTHRIILVRRSAIVRFCLRTGLDKFVYLV